MTIKHIVICGGGEVGFIIQGILTKLYHNNVWHHKDIDTLYSTSVGTLIGLGIVLKIDIETINKYILERPLDFLQVEPQMFFGLIQNKGLFDKNVILKFCSPLLKSLNLSVDITFKELYNYSGIEYNIIVSELNAFEAVQFSHKTHPDFKVLDAINMSCSLPTLFKPVIIGDKCYFDGGLFNNYPITNCINDTNCDVNEILAFKKISANYSQSEQQTPEIKNIFDYINTILAKMIIRCNTDKQIHDLSGANIYDIVSPHVSVESIIGLIDKEKRKILFNQGKNLIENNVDISLASIDISQNDLSCNLII